MADTWLTSDKKKGLLSYIEEGANEEDLFAAGYTKDNLTEVGWYETSEYKDDTGLPPSGDKLEFQPLGLKDVLPFDRPMNAGPNDRVVGLDEMTGNLVYETLSGQQYSIRAADQQEVDARQPLPVKAKKWAEAGMPLPGLGDIASAVKQMPEEAYNTVKRVTDGTGTFGDMFGTIGASAAPGIVSSVGKAADASVISAMGATHKVPSYAKKPPKKAAPLTDDTFDDEGFLTIDTPDVDLDPTGTSNITFRDPLVGVYEEMEIPNKGLKGSDLIKQLQDNPTVRNSQIAAQGILAKIDPKKRYAGDEVKALFQQNPYQVSAVPQTQYQSFQRQFDLVDKETDYTEYAINANSVNSDSPQFKAKDQHYQPTTLAHVRLSDRVGKNGPYVLVEEIQSDLLQKGYEKPPKASENRVADFFADPKNVRSAFSESDPTEFHLAGRVTEEDFAVWRGERVAGFSYEDMVQGLLIRSGLDPDSSFSHNDVLNVMYKLDDLLPTVNNVTTPPITNTSEAVRLTLDTAIAHASKNNITKIVLPPFHKIVEKRFPNDPVGYAKAMDPKSGFSATYVNGVNKVLGEIQKEFGDKIKIGKTDLEYDPNKKEHNFGPTAIPVDWDYDQLGRSFQNSFLSMTGKDVELNEVTMKQIENNFRDIVNKGDLSIGDVLSPEENKRYNSFLNAAFQNIQNFSTTGFNRQIREGKTLKEALESFRVVKKPNITEQGTEIDFSGLLKENYDLTKPKFAEGGAVTNVDPISGNEVPPGSLPKEVRDDVDAKLSEGEYVLPADVVRYFGLDYIEKLIGKAKAGMEEFQARGRIGGKTDGPPDEEGLPFSPEELQAHEADMAAGPPQMAVGGLVPDSGTITDETTRGPLDPSTGLPWGTPLPPPVRVAEAPTIKSDRDPYQPPTGLAGSVDKWSTKDYITYANTKGNGLNKGVGAALSLFVPFGGVALKARNKYLDRAVPTQLDAMIKSGKDAAGNPLSPADLSALKEARAKIGDAPERKGILGGYTGLRDMFDGGGPGMNRAGVAKNPTSSSTSSSSSGGGSSSSGGGGSSSPAPKIISKPAPTATTKAAPANKQTDRSGPATPTKSHAERAGFGKGGLITRR